MPVHIPSKSIFIHIPKTGGQAIISYFDNTILHSDDHISPSIHHPTLLEYNNYLATSKYICDPSFTIFTVVRNPYHRALSELFWRGKSNLPYGIGNITNCTHADIYDQIHKSLYGFLTMPMTVQCPQIEKRRLQQYKYIQNSDGIIDPKVMVVKFETLPNELHNIGIRDFDVKHKINANPYAINYDDYIYGPVKDLIYEYYKDDFLLLDYEH